jgi:hypothetical protein
VRRALALSIVVGVACGGRLPPPKRRVIESDIEGWTFARYQKAVDVEVYVPRNTAVAHAASYRLEEAARRGVITDADVVNAIVSEYQDRAGVDVAVTRFARRLAQESGYTVDESTIGGQRVFRVNGHGEAWAFWSSGRYVVKIGGRGREKIPGEVVKEYGRRYPSRVKRGALDEPLPDDSTEANTR